VKVGTLIIGLRGATASTLVATAMRPNPADLSRFLLSECAAAKRLPLARVDELVWSGWDTRRESWRETIERHRVIDLRLHPELLAHLETVEVLPGIALAADHAAVTQETRPDPRSPLDLLDALRADIRELRKKHTLDQVVVLSLAAPAKLPSRESWPRDAGGFMHALAEGAFTSALPYYFAAAILEGAAIADYTASATLEIPGLIDLAEQHGVPIAGRDGSTGQTLLKSVLAETFATRRLHVRGWYSTNILGNHDGLVLQDERYADVKRFDKTALLEEILGYEVESHLVDIRYYLPAGDHKEAWDAIDFETWFGGQGSLRIDWRCSDSLLATPPLIDLVRFLSFMRAVHRTGIRSELGVFFKHPLGTNERRYLHLAKALERFCQEAAGAVDRSACAL
jgi:myo-inositol-1-phosphate synthase